MNTIKTIEKLDFEVIKFITSDKIEVKCNKCENVFVTLKSNLKKYNKINCQGCETNNKKHLIISKGFIPIDVSVAMNMKAECDICNSGSYFRKQHLLSNGVTCYACRYKHQIKMLQKWNFKVIRYIDGNNIEVECRECGFKHIKIWDNAFRQNKIGCPKCNFSISNGEQIIIKLLKLKNIPFNHEYKLENKYFDFYIPSLNLIIEFDGEQHFKDAWNSVSVTKKNDLLKESICLKNNINLLRISYSEFKNLSKIIDSIDEIIINNVTKIGKEYNT